MEQFLRKSQNSGEITWTRVKRSNGNYGYVRTKNGRPVDFDEYTGKFKMYDLPDTNSNWTEASKAGTSYGKIKSIEIRPGSHADYVAQQKLVDEHVKRVTPTAEDLFTIGTLGGLNNLSPTLWGRRIWDLGQAVQGNMSWNKFGNNWFYGNNGLVSDKYAKEHPYASTAINLVGDAAAFGTLSALKKLPKYTATSTPQITSENATSITPKQWTAKGLGNISNALKGTSGYKNWRLARTSSLTTKSKPNISVTADAGTTTNQGAKALSLEEILKAFNQARQWHLNRINSPGYTQRALRAGFTEEEIPQLLQQLTSLINRLKLLTPEEVFGPNIRRNSNANGKAAAEYWKANVNGNLKQGIAFYDTNASYDDAVSNFIHEFGHGATFGLNGTETSGYMKALADQFPLINRAVKYNRSLYPEVTEETVRKVLPSAAKTGNLGYYAKPTEMLSRGYEFMRDYANNRFKAYKSGNLSSKTHQDLVGNRINSNIFNNIATPEGAANFYKNALGISVPLGLGYGLYSTNDLLQQLLSLKQGGKMNTVEQFKNGSKIHIKKKNRGKFTDYCGGLVTQECINRGKHSSNPAIRKRATFADNARRWKHKYGGFVTGVNVLDSNPRIYKYLTKIKVSPRGIVKKETGGSFVNNALNFINSDTGQSIIGGVSNIIQGMSAKKKLNKAIDALKKAIDELYNVAKNNIDMGARKSLAQANLEYKKALSPGIHFGEIDLGLEENKLKLEAAAKATNDANVLRDQALANLNNQAILMSNEVSNNITGNIGGLLNGAFQLAGNYFSNKTSSNSTTVKPGYTYSKIASNNFSVPKTNFSVNMKL